MPKPPLVDQIKLKFANQKSIKRQTSRSRRWFLNAAQRMGWSQTLHRVTKKKNLTRKISFQEQRFTGRLFMFHYIAETESLPYWDYLPIIVGLKRVDNGFLGLNLHYLPPKLRLYFLEGLHSYILGDPATDGDMVRFKIRYKSLVRNPKYTKIVKASIKRYKFTNVASPFWEIPPSEWEMAVFLRTESFVKENADFVWADLFGGY